MVYRSKSVTVITDQKMTRKPNAPRIVLLIVIGLLLIPLIFGNWLCYVNAQAITNLLCGSGFRFDGENMEQVYGISDEFCQQIEEEGAVLLKNENNTLPLAENVRKVNLFGWRSTDAGFMLTGGGSGAASISGKKAFSLRAGLEAEGFTVNTELLNKYQSYCPSASAEILVDPPASFYTSDLIQQAKEFSDVAIVTISRYGAEGWEIPYTQTKYNLPRSSRHYLELSKEEEAMLDLVKQNFGTVIVLFNLANSLEMGFLQDKNIDAAILMGLPGQSGSKALARILKGTVNPSGRTVDTEVYDVTTAPSYANNRKEDNQISYTEGIYIGYQWYETADHDGFWNSEFAKNKWEIEKGYDDVVMYPFGYGLSYSNFAYEVIDVNVKGQSVSNKLQTVEVKVAVTNEGPYAGRDVLQLYVALPYTKGGIEKPYEKLAAFAKTVSLDVGQTQEVTLSFDLYDIASYDAYDANGNGIASWELEKGTYTLRIGKNAHELLDCEDAETTFEIEQDMNYKLDPTTKNVVKDRFTGESAYAGIPIDGSTAGRPINWLSRNDFEGTFPVERTEKRTGDAVATANTYQYNGYEGATMPKQGVAGDLRIWTRADGSDATADDLKGTSGNAMKLNEALLLELAESYNSDLWEQLLNQMTKEEIFRVVESSGYGTDEATSIGKAFNIDYDGPCGFQYNVGSLASTGYFTGFPAMNVVAQTFNVQIAFEYGRVIGNEANEVGISGWYAPGVNLHRTPFNGRYFEYYSEDGLLSGYMAAYVIHGAKTMNTYAYLKHFAVSEMGENPRQLNVWITEQTLRETYLRPFEIAVKKGGANAVMSAFNNIGGFWSGACKPMLTDILRKEWGFKGVVITDWSTGDSNMVPSRGIRAGNDMWLNPNDTVTGPLNRNDPVDVTLARNAAHNLLWTIADTYKTYKSYDASEDPFTAIVGIRQRDEVFAWWIPCLVALDVLVLAAMTVGVVLIFRKHPAKGTKKSETKAPTENGPPMSEK